MADVVRRLGAVLSMDESLAELAVRTRRRTSRSGELAKALAEGTVIKAFAFVFLIGVAVGTYSSIYVAAPLTEWIDRRFFASKGASRHKPPPRQRQQKQADAVV